MKTLESGRHYWYRNKCEFLWRICYIGADYDGEEWLHFIGAPATPLSNMDLSCFDWIPISEPNNHTTE